MGRLPSSALLLALALAGCGGASSEASATLYPAVALSSGGTFLLEATSPDGAPLVRGIHAFDLRVERASDASEATGLAPQVVPWMPSMGHGSPFDGDVVERAAGVYHVEGVSLFMAGIWELRVTLAPTEEHATLAFDVR